MTRNKGSDTEVVFIEKAFTFLKDAFGHAVTAIQILTNVYLHEQDQD